MYADKIKEARLEKGITQTELALKSGITYSAMSYIENGIKMPSLVLAYRIAKVLEKPMDWFCEDFDKIDYEEKQRIREKIKK